MRGLRTKPAKTAVIGCGRISDIYLTNMINRYSTTLERPFHYKGNRSHSARTGKGRSGHTYCTID